jgi:hydroxypyruvate isomerase
MNDQHPHNRSLTRREALRLGAGAVAAAALTPRAWAAKARVGKFQQGASGGCFGRGASLDERCAMAKEIGLVGLDLCGPGDWETLKKHGLICTMVPSHSLANGLCEPKNHEECLAKIRASVDATSAEGWRNVITLSGNRRGIDDQVGLGNCVNALKQIAPYAEQKKVTLCLEFLNSNVNHKDYMADTTKWCVELVHRVGSPNVKVLYDLYHAGTMGEDCVKDIKEHADCWGHYHTAGVPGRHEIHENQTLDYPAIMQAIAESGFEGYVSHEYSPTGDPRASLRAAFTLCNV